MKIVMKSLVFAKNQFSKEHASFPRFSFSAFQAYPNLRPLTTLITLCLIPLLSLPHDASGGTTTTVPNPTSETAGAPKAERMRWFSDAHFGLFLHWGVYAQLGDSWQGVQCKKAEQIQWEKRIPIAEYTKVAEQFNPVKFDAANWARAAN